MFAHDVIQLAIGSVIRTRLRSAMLLWAMGIGVAGVIVLTALGEGARNYVTGEFRALGTRLIIVIPGRSETRGFQPGIMRGETPRDLTISDAQAVGRIAGVKQVVPHVVGVAPISAQGRERDAPVIGATAGFREIQDLTIARGEFLPPGHLDRDAAICVLGANLARELFPAGNALGNSLRIGDRRFRIIGTLGGQGRSIGLDVQELVIVPVTAAQTLFNTRSLFRLMIEVVGRESMPRLRERT